MKKLPLPALCALASLTLSCQKAPEKDSSPSASAAAKPAAAANVGSMSFGSKTFEIAKTSYVVGTAHAYVTGSDDEKKLELRLFSSTLTAAKECGYEIQGGGDAVTNDQLGLELKTEQKPGPVSTDNVEYTVYYRKTGEAKGTNSGDSRDAKLTITKWTDSEVEGSFALAGSMDIEAKFAAKVCKTE